MPDLKISQLPVASATTGAELFPVVQGGVTKQIALNAVRHIGSAVFDANGSMAVDTNTLFVDAVNNRVGVGTATPASTLDVVGGNISIASGNVFYLSGSGGNAYLQESSGTVFIGAGGAGRVQVNSSGNLGLGVTPSAWGIGKAIEVGATGNAIWGVQAADMRLLVNAYYDGTNYRYNHTATAGRYDCGAIHSWFTAPSGTAGNAISFTERARVDGTTTAGQTALLLWDVDNGTLERVTVGASDSGGTGFKVLRIPN